MGKLKKAFKSLVSVFAPAPPKLPSLPPPAPAQDFAAAEEAAAQAKRRGKAATLIGGRDDIKTSAQGVLGQADIGKKKLLGQ
jgi:hypothetical protein